MKRLTAFVLALVCVFGLVGCNREEELQQDDNAPVYSCEPREINGEEGLLWVDENGAVLLTLYGAEATAYVTENGGVEDGAGYWYLAVSALAALPDGISLSDTQAAALVEIPEEAEWVIVYPDDDNEKSQK